MRYALVLAVGAFAVATPLWGTPTATAAAQQEGDRFIQIEGGRNFRDAGGYRTANGKLVRRGVLYRSGSLGSLSAAGERQLAQLRPAAIIDLRTTEERSHDNSKWASAVPGYWTRDYRYSQGDFSAFDKGGKLTASSVRSMMAGGYRRFAKEQAVSYRQLFAALLSGKEPVVVNCTAGKDRTGIATALVLTALGVPYETVRQDFLLSNGAPGMDSLAASLSPKFASLPPDVVGPLIGVEGEYLDTAFAQLRTDYGSIEGFLQKELGVGPREIARLKRRMLAKRRA